MFSTWESYLYKRRSSFHSSANEDFFDRSYDSGSNVVYRGNPIFSHTAR